jgi:hypothetical protein
MEGLSRMGCRIAREGVAVANKMEHRIFQKMQCVYHDITGSTWV